jgi:hypothetical protein
METRQATPTCLSERETERTKFARMFQKINDDDFLKWDPHDFDFSNDDDDYFRKAAYPVTFQ